VRLDLDIKAKGYANLDDALADLKRFIDSHRLPPPNALVASGSGLHVY
jgi:hypothetical protein